MAKFILLKIMLRWFVVEYVKSYIVMAIFKSDLSYANNDSLYIYFLLLFFLF